MRPYPSQITGKGNASPLLRIAWRSPCISSSAARRNQDQFFDPGKGGWQELGALRRDAIQPGSARLLVVQLGGREKFSGGKDGGSPRENFVDQVGVQLRIVINAAIFDHCKAVIRVRGFQQSRKHDAAEMLFVPRTGLLRRLGIRIGKEWDRPSCPSPSFVFQRGRATTSAIMHQFTS
jgi:hypothetical protein